MVGLSIILIFISVFKSAGTLYDNFWMRHDNKVREEVARAEQMAYAKGVAEESKKGLEEVKRLYSEMDKIRSAYSEKIAESDKLYHEGISRDIEGKLKKLEANHEEFNERAKRASIRELQKKRDLSDLSTVHID